MRHPAAHREADRVDALGVDAGLRLDLRDQRPGERDVVDVRHAAGPHVPGGARRAGETVGIRRHDAFGIGLRLVRRAPLFLRARAAERVEVDHQRHRRGSLVRRRDVKNVGSAGRADLDRQIRIAAPERGRRTRRGRAAASAGTRRPGAAARATTGSGSAMPAGAAGSDAAAVATRAAGPDGASRPALPGRAARAHGAARRGAGRAAGRAHVTALAAAAGRAALARAARRARTAGRAAAGPGARAAGPSVRPAGADGRSAGSRG